MKRIEACVLQVQSRVKCIDACAGKVDSEMQYWALVVTRSTRHKISAKAIWSHDDAGSHF